MSKGLSFWCQQKCYTYINFYNLTCEVWRILQYKNKIKTKKISVSEWDSGSLLMSPH